MGASRFSVGPLLLLLVAGLSHAAERQPNPVPGHISPQAQEYLARVRLGQMPDRGSYDDAEYIQRVRSVLGKMFLSNAKKIDPDLFLTRQNFNGVDAFWINTAIPEPAGRIILYLHGGGHILGSAQTNLGTGLRIGSVSGIPVLAVEYRLAPEHPYPADIEDVLVVYRALLDGGYQANQIGIYGDSAGGGLSVSSVLAARAAGLPLPAAVVALSPSVDFTREGDTRITLADFDPVLRTPGNPRLYRGDAPASDPLLSPVFADFSSFPPLLIQVGSREVLLSDSFRLARKARSDGAEVTLDVWDGMWHVWQDVPDLPEAEQACREIAAFFLTHLASM